MDGSRRAIDGKSNSHGHMDDVQCNRDVLIQHSLYLRTKVLYQVYSIRILWFRFPRLETERDRGSSRPERHPTGKNGGAEPPYCVSSGLR
jgi:hypothetical protein